jgi:hypothetical protein
MRRYTDDASLRLDILGDLPPLIKEDPPKYQGNMVYDGKTGATIDIIKDPKVFAKVKADNARTANQSTLRMQAPNGGRTM